MLTMIISLSRKVVFFVGVVIGVFSTPLNAEQVAVAIGATGFLPNQVTINVGDSVLWFNSHSNSTHTTTSDKLPGDPDYWNQTLSYLQFYQRTFLHVGTFTYHDNNSSFTGTVIVNAPSNVRLQTPRKVGAQFIFDATGLTAGKTNVLYVSTNLTQWTAIATNTAPGTSMTFTNSANIGRNFYRLQQIL